MNDTMKDCESLFEQVVAEMNSEEFSPTESKRFTIDTDAKAEWALRIIREEKAELERIVQGIKDQISFYQDRLEKVTNRAENRNAYLMGMLRTYFDTVPHIKTKTGASESYEIAGGKLVLKHREPTTTRDDAVLGAWMFRNDISFVDYQPKIDWAGFKKTLTRIDHEWYTADGKKVEGVTVTDQDDVFDIK